MERNGDHTVRTIHFPRHSRYLLRTEFGSSLVRDSIQTPENAPGILTRPMRSSDVRWVWGSLVLPTLCDHKRFQCRPGTDPRRSEHTRAYTDSFTFDPLFRGMTGTAYQEPSRSQCRRFSADGIIVSAESSSVDIELGEAGIRYSM